MDLVYMDVDTVTAKRNVSHIASLNELIQEAYRVADESAISRAQSLMKVIKDNRFWPTIQVKEFFDSNLTLLHTSYSTCNQRKDISHGVDLKQFYDECRSVVLDLSKDACDNVVVTFANTIPERLTIEAYRLANEANEANEAKIHECYEGTMVYVYHHDGEWHFSTSSCPSIDRSKYASQKTHGMMLDDAMNRLLIPYNDDVDDSARKRFCTLLDIRKSYAFVIVHHQNVKIMNYDAQFGPDYASLIHVYSRDRETMQYDDISCMPMCTLGVFYPKRFASPQEAADYVTAAGKNTYGILIEHARGVWKVSNEDILNNEAQNLGHPNVWYNMLWVYMQHKQHFKIEDYLEKYCPMYANVPIVDSIGRTVSPTYVIHTAMMTLRDILYDQYRTTTRYYIKYGSFKMDKEKDALLPPILRFHLAQLRNIQVSTTHRERFLTKQTVFHYLTMYLTIKDLARLMGYITNQTFFYLAPNAASCFFILHNGLSTR